LHAVTSLIAWQGIRDLEWLGEEIQVCLVRRGFAAARIA